MNKKLFLGLVMLTALLGTISAKSSRKADSDTETQNYEVRKRQSNYVVLDIVDVRRIEIECAIPKKEAQMKFDILDDFKEFDNFKERSQDGDYRHIFGCDYLGENYHKILDKNFLAEYQKKGVDELYLVFANRNIMRDSKVTVTVKYTYYKDGEAPKPEED